MINNYKSISIKGCFYFVNDCLSMAINLSEMWIKTWNVKLQRLRGGNIEFFITYTGAEVETDINVHGGDVRLRMSPLRTWFPHRGVMSKDVLSRDIMSAQGHRGTDVSVEGIYVRFLFCPLIIDILACQAHPALVNLGQVLARLFHFNGLLVYTRLDGGSPLVSGLVHLCTD